MALTPKASKTLVFLAIVIAIVTGGFYFNKTKSKLVEKPAVTEVAPKAIQDEPKIVTEQPGDRIVESAPVKKQHVAKTVVKKHKKHEPTDMSYEEKTVQKEISTGDALNALAGKDKL